MRDTLLHKDWIMGQFNSRVFVGLAIFARIFGENFHLYFSFLYFVSIVNKTIIPLAFLGYAIMLWPTQHYTHPWLSIVSYTKLASE